MRYLSVAFICFLALTSCKEQSAEPEVQSIETSESPVVDRAKIPRRLQEVFKAHGGLQKWNDMTTLTFELGEEIHTVNLNNRNVLIENKNFTLGSENSKVWIAQDSVNFPPARARFYHNLMFYFYAMPFVLADKGITYTTTEPLNVDGKSFPGLVLHIVPV